MKLLRTPAPVTPGKPARGFSLVEVTLALGIMAFCMIPLLGLLPTGLDAQRSAQESARATVAMNLLSTAVHSAPFTRDATTGAVTYTMPVFFSDGTAQSLSTASTKIYAVLEDGTIRKSTDTTPARQTMFVQTFAPPTGTTTLQVYAYITWPALPTDASGGALSSLKNRQGAVESFVTYAPSN